MNATTSNMLDVALGHARRGLKVLPVEPGQKKPLISGWQHAASTDEQQVRSWWTANPNANVGIYAENLCVIDVDTKNGKDGFASLAALEAELAAEGGQLDATLETESPSGGRHLFYRLPPGSTIRNGVDVLGEGLDIRTTGGYVVAAGSKTAAGEYRIVADEPIAEIDPKLLERLATRAPAQRDTSPAVETDEEAAEHRAIEYLHSLEPAPEGQRNHRLMLAARNLGDFGLSVDRAVAVALEHFRCAGSLDDEEIERTVRSAYNRRQTPVGSRSPEGMGFQETSPEEQAAQAAQSAIEKAANKGKLYTFPIEEGRLRLDLARKPSPRRYVVPRFVPAGITAVMAGHGGHGKSLVLLYFAVAVALGRAFFEGMEPCEPGAVLIALGEEDEAEAYRRLFAIAEQLKLSAEDLDRLRDRVLLFACMGQDVRLTGHQSGLLQGTGLAGVIADRMKEHAAACGLPAALIGLDHFLLFSGGEVNANEDAGAYARETGSIVKQTGATVLTVAHSPKGDADKKLDQHSVLGAVSTANLARLVLLVQRMTPGEAAEMRVPKAERWGWLNVWAGKANYTKAGAGIWLREQETAYETVTLERGNPEANRPAKETADQQARADAELLIAFLRAEEARGVRHNGRSLEDAKKRIGPDGMTRARVRDAVTTLSADGDIVERDLPAAEKRNSRQTYYAVLRDPNAFEAAT